MRIKNVNDIARLIAAREGKKKSVNIAQIKEILGIMCDIVFEQPTAILRMVECGERRKSAKSKAKNKKKLKAD